MPLMDIIIPQDIVGDIEDCVIVTWLKHIGDDIESDETLLIIQAAKTSYDIAAPVGGKVVEILADQGDVVNTTQVLARIETADNPPGPPSDAVEKAPPETLAGEQQKATGEKAVAFTGARQLIARRMYDSLQTMAQLTLFSEADATALVYLRNTLKKDSPITYTDLVIRACCLALRQRPIFNALLQDETILQLPDIHIGIAVSLDDGLMVPVIFDCGQKDIAEIAVLRSDLAERARLNRLKPAESSGSTFTVTNLGNFDIGHFTPIINPPEAAILGLGRISEKVVFVEGSITHRPVLPLSLTFDHRINDGAPAAAFLQSIKDYLEAPEQLL